MRRLVWLGLAVLVAACGGDDDDDDLVVVDAAVEVVDAPPPDATVVAACLGTVLPGPEHQQYILDLVLLPTSATQAQQFGLDLDGDPQGRPDNALGQILSTLASQGDVPMQELMDAAVLDGTIMHLLDVKTGTPEVRLLLGDDCDAPPNPADNFSGDELLVVAEDAPVDPPLPASLLGGELRGGPGNLTIEVLIMSQAPVRLPLYGARIEGTVSASAVTNGKLGGGMKQTDVDAIIIPAIAVGMQETVAAECFGSFPNCCPSGSTGETLLDLFDSDDDCAISVDEFRNNDLISSLLSPDVDLFDAEGNFNPRVDSIKDSLSLGVGFTAVGARFELPAL